MGWYKSPNSLFNVFLLLNWYWTCSTVVLSSRNLAQGISTSASVSGITKVGRHFRYLHQWGTASTYKDVDAGPLWFGHKFQLLFQTEAVFFHGARMICPHRTGFCGFSVHWSNARFVSLHVSCLATLVLPLGIITFLIVLQKVKGTLCITWIPKVEYSLTIKAL